MLGAQARTPALPAPRLLFQVGVLLKAHFSSFVLLPCRIRVWIVVDPTHEDLMPKRKQRSPDKHS